MENLNLEQVKELVVKLSLEDRLKLWQYIADLPDSGVQTGDLEAPETTLDGLPAEGTDPDLPVMVSTGNHALLFLKSREILQVTFRPENFRQSQMEIRSWKDAPPSDEVKAQIQEILRLHGAPERTEEELLAAHRQTVREIFEAATLRTSTEFAELLKHFVWLLYDGGMKVAEIGWRNDLARQTGTPTLKLDLIIKTLQPHWKRIKTHLNLSPGGRQNVKHQWSVRDRTCLAVHYDRLKPIWRGAKKAAKQAQEAKELSRRKTWKDQVAAAYKDADLPDDLVAQLAPDINAQPADLALLHAARLCLPVSYSTKVLKQKLRKFNPTPKASSKSTKNKGTS